jgi:hypothetical protein
MGTFPPVIPGLDPEIPVTAGGWGGPRVKPGDDGETNDGDICDAVAR